MTRVAVVGAGQFGAHHARVYRELSQQESSAGGIDLVGVYDPAIERAAKLAEQYGCRVLSSLDEIADVAQAASVTAPTEQHTPVGCALLDRGVDVLVEKPIAAALADADRLISAAARSGRILQVGHLERYNPAVVAARQIVTRPMFFEVHRMSVFTPRSLDVDVVLDLMIHDLDLVLDLTGSTVSEVRAVGLAVLSPRTDIANVRLALENGCVANFTASRVSTEKVRKLRFFQPGEYVSIDYSRQDAVVFSVKGGGEAGIGFRKLETKSEEPLRAELADFLRCVRERREPVAGGVAGRRALETALRVNAAINEHARRLQLSLSSHG